MSGQLANETEQVSRLGLGSRTVRFRLTALYGGLFLLSGAALLGITYLIVAHFPGLRLPPRPPGAPPGGPYALVAEEQAARLHDLLAGSGIALAFMAFVSVWLGWLVAGRVLRPLRTITATTKQISEDNLHQRLALQGPDDEIKDLTDAVDGLLNRLERAFDAQRNFVANASHELRTPLTLSQALLQMRLREPHASATEFRSTCEEVLATGQQQERLIESLLVLARSQHGLDRHELLDLAVIAAQVAAANEEWSVTQGVHLEVSAQSAMTSGDVHLVERLISNLIENAIRYNRRGGKVKVTIEAKVGATTLRVENTGPSVPEDQVARLFEPFQRAANFRTGEHDGLGLGLSIVAAVARAHGAKLTAKARLEGGLDVRVDFPLVDRHRTVGSSAFAPPARELA